MLNTILEHLKTNPSFDYENFYSDYEDYPDRITVLNLLKSFGYEGSAYRNSTYYGYGLRITNPNFNEKSWEFNSITLEFNEV